MANDRSVKVKGLAWERPAIFVLGVVFVLLLLVLAIAFPEPTAFQYLIFRTILALAAGGIAALVPGMLDLAMSGAGFALRACGALAVLVLVYFYSPAALVAAPPLPPAAVVTYRICSGEYERNCQPHDVYQYCYGSTENWARARCTSYRIIRLDTRDGNKCGYSLDQIICTGPR
jgi:hypothetical protein